MKKLTAIVLAALVMCSIFAFTACGENNTDPPGVKTYTFEAEGVDLSEQSGHGWSNNANGCQMIQGKNTAKIRSNSKVLNSISNEYFVGFFGVENTEFVFEITSDADDAEATLVLRLASEWGTLLVDQTVMKIVVNDVNLEYTPFSVTGKKIEGASEIEYGEPFVNFTIDTKISLKQGANVIKLVAQGKGFGENTAMDIGPGVDCIKVKSKASLTWESLWEDNKLNVKYEE